MINNIPPPEISLLLSPEALLSSTVEDGSSCLSFEQNTVS
jgi:hypothetical protein